jgi:hypothetical protein
MIGRGRDHVPYSVIFLFAGPTSSVAPLLSPATEHPSVKAHRIGQFPIAGEAEGLLGVESASD